MNLRLSLVTTVLAASTFGLFGCATGPNQQLGIGGGAIAGALAGNALGNSTAATVGGAAVGGLIGNEIGKSVDERNRQRSYGPYNSGGYGAPY